ncbi:ECF transporter S component [Lacticaseibacillus saniviri]|uniref:Membrane protein n=1 Tax=Lacticaseibacillus saniviri JCM 17471 = DSM 24301 TaxID=1293598 RepID=A0A0R2MZ19_9LACO|nr:ECF transporter S component [Lacticaseibacillus saniviri]KRO16026.1 membrane protein [Lacticaseibacillus saniviri JCM 17471 = DSM 24301]MCG4281513.1 ECF transporter S component [Lacticaseibacillus saniviri]
MGHKRISAYQISIVGILSALIILQTFIPFMGNITIPGLPALTIVHITVIIGAVILGPKQGALLGGIWGTMSLIRAYTQATDPLTILLFRNPLIAIIPRILVGLVAGLVFNYIAKTHRKDLVGVIKMSAAGVLGALTNTCLFVLFTWMMYIRQPGTVIPGSSGANLGYLLIVMVLGNAVVEMISAGVITPILGQALIRFKRN